MIRVKLAGEADAIRAFLSTTATDLFGVTLDWTAAGHPAATMILGCLRLSVLFTPAVAACPGGPDPATGWVTAAAEFQPEGADVLVSLHGTPTEGDHLTAIAAALPMPGQSVAAVTRLSEAVTLSAGWG